MPRRKPSLRNAVLKVPRSHSEITDQKTDQGEKQDEDWVPIQFPDNFEAMVEAFANCTEERIGWCLLCNSPIHTEAGLIPGTSTHNCAAGRALEARIAEQARQDQ